MITRKFAMHIGAARFTSLCEKIFKNCYYFINIIIQILVQLLFYSLNKRDLKERLFNLKISSNWSTCISWLSILSKDTFDQACDWLVLKFSILKINSITCKNRKLSAKFYSIGIFHPAKIQLMLDDNYTKMHNRS